MVITQSRSKRKTTGGRYISSRRKRLYESGSPPTLTKIEKTKLKKEKTKGGNIKLKLHSADTANVVDPKTNKISKAKIKTVIESPANRHFTRRNIMVKGSIIDTDKGKAKITSRPGQDGIINAVLVTS
ncbi:30S ribosomal protein S8e [Candidatus Woesearchaeota archaeon]|nr:30S ribosomal protein S8e [Candidatus Woesearchaeota archaeon]